MIGKIIFGTLKYVSPLQCEMARCVIQDKNMHYGAKDQRALKLVPSHVEYV